MGSRLDWQHYGLREHDDEARRRYALARPGNG
jgi:hypothetical protein